MQPIKNAAAAQQLCAGEKLLVLLVMCDKVGLCLPALQSRSTQAFMERWEQPCM